MMRLGFLPSPTFRCAVPSVRTTFPFLSHFDPSTAIALLKNSAMPGSASIDGAASPAPPQDDRDESTDSSASDDGQAGAPNVAGYFMRAGSTLGWNTHD